MLETDTPAPTRAPVRRALDAILLRWLGLYVLAGSVVACPILCGVGVDHLPWWRAVLPLFLVGFIAVHLRHRQRAVRADGWQRAVTVDPGSVGVLFLVGALTLVCVAVCLASMFWPYDDPIEVMLFTSVGGPILVPLYAISIWVAVDCATRRLARSADDADRAVRDYWRQVARR